MMYMMTAEQHAQIVDALNIGIAKHYDLAEDVRVGDALAMLKAMQPVAQPLTWQPIETAPKDGTKVLVYRPLAHLTNDDVVSIKHSIAHSRPCWNQTIPKGIEPKKNFTDGACYPTHWMPLPAAPSHGIGAKE